MIVSAVHGISRVFRGLGGADIRALQDVDLELSCGELVAVTGPSGGGKSTLLAILGLLDDGYAGAHRFEGAGVAGLSETARAELRLARIGFVFQGFHLVPGLSAAENVALPHWRLHGRRGAAMARAVSLLESVGLGARHGHDVRRLSGGEMQRVAFARALVNEPALILADEPTGNLDHASATAIVELLSQAAAEGRTVCVATHAVDLTAAATRVVELRYGRLTPHSTGE